MQAEEEAALERQTMRTVYWRLLPFLLLLYIISWLDRVNVSFAKLQMGPDLGIGDAAFGMGFGFFFFLSYALCEVPSNLMLARYGARVWIARIMITWGIISVAMMFVQGAYSFYVLRFLLGAAEAGFLPGIIYYLSHWFPRSYRAKAVSWFMIGIPLSVVFGAPLSGWIMPRMKRSSQDGWKTWSQKSGRPSAELSSRGSRKGNVTRYPVANTMRSISSELPSLKRTSRPLSSTRSGFGSTAPRRRARRIWEFTIG